MRLDKYLAHSGFGTRNEVKALILDGKVTVNGQVVKKSDIKVNESKDQIKISGIQSNYQKYVYLMLHKPAGYISANKDNMHKVTKDLIVGYEHIETFPVGRLDIDTEGLLIITNDGLLSHQLLSPRYHVDKTYYVIFNGTYYETYTQIFETGVTLDDGYVCMPSKIKLINEHEALLTIKEGKYHQVKRMFEALSMKVTYLKRVSFGPIELDEKLEKGHFRPLTDKEVELLKQIVL